MTFLSNILLFRPPTVVLRAALACAGSLCAAGAHAFPTLPEARAFLNPQLGYLNCGPASGGFAASCAASGTAVGGTEASIAVVTGPSTASYALGRDPSVNITSDFERVYPSGGGGYVEGGAASAELLFQVAYCTMLVRSMPSATQAAAKSGSRSTACLKSGSASARRPRANSHSPWE